MRCCARLLRVRHQLGDRPALTADDIAIGGTEGWIHLPRRRRSAHSSASADVG